MNNRLQFRHHNEVFDTREAAIEYIQSQIRFAEEGLAKDEKSYGFSLLAEPTVLLYKKEEDETDPHLILVIGSQTNDGTQYSDNRFCIIDIDKTEQEIADLQEELEDAIKSLTLIALSSDTLNFYAEKTDEGTYVSGDVKVAETHIFDDVRYKNNLMVTPEGLFIYVNLTYDEAAETFTFTVSNADGTLSKTSVKLPNNYLVSGYYDKTDESIHLKMKEGEEVIVDCEELIAEWDVEGDASNTPVVLTREKVDYDHTDEHHHVEPWQDVLRADIRIKDEQKILQPDGTYKYVKDENSTNILDRTSDGRQLFVDGKASNIIYYSGGTRTNVKAALDELSKIKLSSDNDNIIINKVDGFFASTTLEYKSKENKLIFKASGQPDTTIKLNSFKLFENIYYDPTQEALVITYIDGNDQVQIVTIPIGQMIRDWEWEPQNEGHNVTIVKKRNVAGNDKVSADVKISNSRNNIFEDDDHKLYVRGEADNIKYEPTGDTTVKDVLDDLKATDAELDNRINIEIARAEAAETVLENKIGTGFTDDPHDNVTYKFEELQNQVNDEADRLTNEINRSTSADTVQDGRLDAIDAEIGDGFGPRNTVRDEIDNLQSEIDAVSADSASSLKDIINTDNSINIDKTSPIRPVISVNLSETESGNTIRLEGDGLYNFIDLSYNETTNVLTLTKSDNTSTENKTKDIQLNSVSVIDGMEYDPTTETLIIKYHSGSEEKELRIPLGEIFQEWEVYNDPDSAVKLNRERVIDGKDKLSGIVVLSPRSGSTEDNIIENVNGALYVPGAAISANAAAIDALEDRIDIAEQDIDNLETGLANEIARATNAETSLRNDLTTTQENLADEVTRAKTAESALSESIQNEVTRSTTKDQELAEAINTERVRSTSAETALQAAIDTEEARATVAEESLSHLIDDEAERRNNADLILQDEIDREVARATAAESALTVAITNETARARAKEDELEAEDANLARALQQEAADRAQGDADLAQAIRDAELTFDDTSSIDFTKASGNIVTADVKLQEGDNIIKLGQGLYASVHLSYDPGTNKIRLVTSNGADEEIQLVGASLLEDLHYDPVEKQLVITYKDATGEEHTVSFGVEELFNDWIIQNPTEKSALELVKTPASAHTAGSPDVLNGRVLITDDHDGDGKPDQGSDNIIEIRNNGLYVDGTPISAASATAECAKNEIKVLERVVLGHVIGEECGSGYTYEPNNVATYIITANSFNNADLILDQNLKRVEDDVQELSGETICIDEKTDKIYELLYGEGHSLPQCGEGASYQPYQGSCVISAASSFYEADELLDDQICYILTMWTSGQTCTTNADWVPDGLNRKLQVDVRLSHGKYGTETDNDMLINSLDGNYIDPTTNELTDTNVLRIVCLDEGPSGITPSIESKQNGVYLSNIWDCGLYYDEGTPADQEARNKAQAAGYNVNYTSDESASARNINYMNNVRQHDI